MPETYREYYKQQLEEGREFQDHVCETVFKTLGLPIMQYSSTRYQYSKGESVNGVEIKLDKRLNDTQNIYIEEYEKAHPENSGYVPSGIKIAGNWLYIIGDYNIIYVMPVSILILSSRSDKFKRVQTPTSRGFLMPVSTAEKWAVKTIRTPGENNVDIH